MDKFVFSIALLLCIGCSSVRGVDEFVYRITNLIKSPFFDIPIRLPAVINLAFIDSMQEAARRFVTFEFTSKYFGMGGEYIVAINDVFEDVAAKTYWEFFYNGVAISVGPSDLFPAANDNVHFNFTSDQH